VLVPGVGVDDVPLLRHRISANGVQEGRISSIALDKPRSTIDSASVSTATTISTPIVPAIASWRVGQVTLRNSARTSVRNCRLSENQTRGFNFSPLTLPFDCSHPPPPGFGHRCPTNCSAPLHPHPARPRLLDFPRPTLWASLAFGSLRETC